MPESEIDLEHAIRKVTAAANNPALRRHVENVSGVALDRVAEVVLTQVHCESGSELRLSDVAIRLGVELSSVSRKVQKMETDGLIARSCDPADARAYRLRITARGREHMDAVRNARSNFISHATTDWPEADRELLFSLLSRLVSDLDRSSSRLG